MFEKKEVCYSESTFRCYNLRAVEAWLTTLIQKREKRKDMIDQLKQKEEEVEQGFSALKTKFEELMERNKELFD